MAVALHKENYVLHKLHSLSGIIPVGYYLVQHLALNSFTLAGPNKFNGVIGFFENIPKFALLAFEALGIWLPLLFHAVYGLFIVGRGQQNFVGTKFKWSQNRMYSLQRWSGIFIFFFLIYHVLSTTGLKYLKNDATLIEYAAWQDKLTANGYILLVIYMLGVLASTYHLAYGIWNFCIRWGITISDAAQMRIQKFALGFFVVLTLIGWGALAGFLIHDPKTASVEHSKPVPVEVIPTSVQG